MLPKLSVDCAPSKRTAALPESDMEHRQPEDKYRHVASSQSANSLGGSSPVGGTYSTRSLSSTSSAPGHARSLSPPLLSPYEIPILEDGVVGISDPEMTTILAAKSRYGSGERSPSSERLGAISGLKGPGGHFFQSKRRAAPLTTLVDHQQARQTLPQQPKEGDDAGGRAEGTGKTNDGGAAEGASHAPKLNTPSSIVKCRVPSSFVSSRSPSRSPPAATEVSAGARSSSSSGQNTISTMTVEEVYIAGKPFRMYMNGNSTRLTSSDTLAGPTSTGSNGNPPVTAAASSGTHATTSFHQNPSQYVSALATQGDFVAVGDRTGRVTVMRRREMGAGPRRTLLEIIRRTGDPEEGEVANFRASATSLASSPCSLSRQAASLHRVRDPYEFYVAQQAYVPVIDTLNSVEVSPTVMALSFLPQSGPTTYLLAANEKIPKLYRVMQVRESANSFRAVDKIGTKTIGPLTASARTSTTAMKLVSTYAMNHEYRIHSLCPIAYSDQFATADDSTVLLWCTEYPDASIEIYDLRARYGDGPEETIRAVRNYPHEPFLFFIATSGGSVRVVDTRQTLRLTDQTAQFFVNPPREEDEPFSSFTNSISDCALSPSGRYIAGRDFMSVCLWDIRMAASGGVRNGTAGPRWPGFAARGTDAAPECSIVQRWALHPHLRDDLDTLYQSNLLFERFDVQFLSGRQVCTGGFNNTLYTMDVESTKTDTTDDVRTFLLLRTEGISEFRRTTVSAHRLGEDYISAGQGLGSRMTLMSRPCMSMSGSCGMMMSCGQAVLQLSYNGLFM